ncbi:MAG: hypothetical protein Q7T18_05830 [Sedimentisphaerales bacterium]|nr:hypothetical protein [Sedimentisphaerales bacterium]
MFTGKNLVTVLAVALLTTVCFAADPNYQAAPLSGTYLASGLADASGSGGTASLEYWVWNGGNGYYYYTYRVLNSAFNPYICYLTISNPTREPYTITGCSGGWNPQTGEKGTPWTASSSITQIAVIQWASNSPYTNIYPGKNSWDTTDGQLFQFASKLPPTSAGFTVMQGDSSINASGLVPSPGSSTTSPRSVGYWKQQSGTKGERKEAGSVPNYLNVIEPVSNVFDAMSVASCNTILAVPDNSDMRQKAKAQLLALWLNVVSGKLNYDSQITFHDPAGQSVTMSPKQAIAAAEGAILNTAATSAELEYAKDLAEILDNL